MTVLDYFEVFGYLFVLISFVFCMIASANVNSTFRRYQKQFSRRGITAAEAARMVLRAGGATGVQIARTHGNLTDHFDPRDNTIYLSEAVFDSTSTAAIGVAAHEAGHAVQHAVGYLPIRIRAAIIPVTNIGARFAPLLIMIGLFLSIYAAFPFGYELALLGVFFYSFSVIFQLVTLPTEFNASARAMAALKNENILDDVELVGARKTLTAAAMTYVASLAASLIQLIRLFAIVTSGRRRD